MNKFKSGFIAIIGRPNVGKSTFINYVLGRKVSIISPKPQTTRNIIQGIYTTDHSQMIFIDTPGVHKPHHELGEFMNKSAINTLRDVDLVIFICDGKEKFGTGDEFVLNLLKKTKVPCFLIVNKIDLIHNNKMLEENINQFENKYNFKKTFKISAKEGTNIDTLLEEIENILDEGPMYYPKDQITDHPEQFIISELIREKVLLLTKEEVPHSVVVTIEDMKHDENNLMNISALIIVERQSQKKIIIGNGGNLIKEIGTLARKDIVMLLGEKIYLSLWVKVEENWRNNTNKLRKYGYFIDKN